MEKSKMKIGDLVRYTDQFETFVVRVTGVPFNKGDSFEGVVVESNNHDRPIGTEGNYWGAIVFSKEKETCDMEVLFKALDLFEKRVKLESARRRRPAAVKA